MTTRIRTQEGETAEEALWRAAGDRERLPRGQIEAALEANPDLPARAPVLPAGVAIDVPAPAPMRPRATIRLWD